MKFENDLKGFSMLNIDIMLLVGGRSGFELSLNRTVDYLCAHGCHVRYIQLKETGYDWSTSNAEFTCFGCGDDIVIEYCRKKYVAFLLDSYSPDLMIIAGFPHIISIAKGAFEELGITNCPTIAWPHNDLYFYDNNIYNTLSAIDMADIVFAISNKVARDVESNLPGKLIYRVNNTIDYSKLEFSSTRNTLKLACVGRLSLEKNYSLPIKAIAKAKDNWSLTIIGDGEELPKLKELADKLHVSNRLSFTGWLDDPWKAVSDSRAFIMSSDTEGSPLVCIEALSCGIPVISTPVANLPEIIQDGINGYLFPFNDVEALANVLNNLAMQPFTSKTAENCVNSVRDFLPETALWDFLCKAYASSRLIGLPQRHWKDPTKRIIRYKASVILSDIEIALNSSKSQTFLTQLKALDNQTIEKQYLEMIIVHSPKCNEIESQIMEFEQNHPEYVMIINCDNIESKEEAYNIGMQYASGDMFFYIDIEDYLTSDTIENWYMDKLCNP